MVNSREKLKEYCLRALGDPVVEINVDDEQLEDRLDEALAYWSLYHYEGVEEMYMKQLIRASEMILSDAIAENYDLSEKITGATSGATAQVVKESSRVSSGNFLLIKGIVGEFIPGELIVGNDSHQSTTLVSLTKREFDNKYIEIPDYVYGITKILSAGVSSSSKNIFNIQYQLRLNDIYDLTSTSIIYYKTVMSHLSMLDLELNGHRTFRFNRLTNKLYINANWQTDVILGDYIIIQGYRALDPNSYTKAYNEPWLKHYTTALFKRQWAINIKKFSGIQLTGGVTLDGDKLYQEATDEIRELESELQHKSAPLDFFLG